MASAKLGAAIGGLIVLGLLAAAPVQAQDGGAGPAGRAGGLPMAPGSGIAQPAPGSLPGPSLIESLNRALDRALAAPQGARAAQPAINTLIAPSAPPKPAPVVVELFTSQGCSACPPADALLAKVAERPDVVALSLHVDYWDYLGWEDPFAQPAFTARQRGYVRAAGGRTLYTPQVIVGGAQSLTAPAAGALDRMIAAQAAAPPQVAMAVSQGEEAGQYVIDLAPVGRPLKHETVVQIVRYVPQAQVEILRGENAGKVLDFANVVTAWHAVAEWDGQAPLRLNAKIDGGEPAVVIVQAALPGKAAPLPGPILSAARLR